MSVHFRLKDILPVKVSETAADSDESIIAAVDLGSNSFHMLVARLEPTGFQIIDKLREQVRLAAGLDSHGAIDAEARERALRCLSRFGQRLRGLPGTRVRAVGTNTLREASNAAQFVSDAEAALGHPIEAISGVEEARLIYAGVVQGLAPSQSGRLVADIGGGSTEIIAGHLNEPQLMESLPLGCVTLTEHFFPDGRMTGKAWRSTLLHAEVEIQAYAETFRRKGWEQAIGASGTVRAIQKVIAAEGWGKEQITREGLQHLVEAIGGIKKTSRLRLRGLSASRRAVFPGGVAILAALFEVLGIDRMDVSDAALREGVLLDFVERSGPRDIRARSVQAMATRLGVDQVQAERVAGTAAWLLDCMRDDMAEAHFAAPYLEWAARLHEVGLSVSHAGYHKHGAYIVENADLMGFSNAEQAFLAALIRPHRGRFQAQSFAALQPRFARAARFLAIVLRLSVLLHRSRLPVSKEGIEVEGGTDQLHLRFPPGWLEAHPLTAADLEEEAQALLKAADFTLRFE